MDVTQILPDSAISRNSELEQLVKELQTIIDSVHDGIWVIDANGFTVYVNQSMKRIANIEPADVVGKHVTVPLKEGKFSTCVTLEALKKQTSVTMFDDYSCGTRCLNSSTPIFNSKGEIWRVVATIRDMSKLEKLQTHLAGAEMEASKHAGKLTELEHDDKSGIIAVSESMRSCLVKMAKVALEPLNVLLLGETGTGKTLAASYIHENSSRSSGPFISVNCAAIPDSLFESELFGYEKGSFTGAGKSGRKGCFELADKGTLLLDEIGELPLAVQAKLLHVLDKQAFRRVGGEKDIKVDVRIIAATNKPVETLIKSGNFREDLFYRLRVLSISIPPLCKRPEDIPEMAMFFLKEACKRHGKTKTFSPKALRCLSYYSWPGNVRDLKALVDYLTAMTEGCVICLAALPRHILENASRAGFSDINHHKDEEIAGIRAAVRSLEKKMLLAAIISEGSTHKAAKLLGISQSTVVRKIQNYGILLKS